MKARYREEQIKHGIGINTFPQVFTMDIESGSAVTYSEERSVFIKI